MESYKLVNSREVQEKAFRLGYRWEYIGKKVCREESIFLYAHNDGLLSCNSSSDIEEQTKYFSGSPKQEITQADFLALPEPLKVGDWVGHTFDRTIGDETFDVFEAIPVINISEDGKRINEDDIVYLPVENCTKLTPEQIKVLGLK